MENVHHFVPNFGTYYGVVAVGVDAVEKSQFVEGALLDPDLQNNYPI